MGINKTITTKLQFCYPFCTSKLKNHSLTSVFAHFFYKICHFLKNTIVVNFVKQKLIVVNSRQFRHIETCLIPGENMENLGVLLYFCPIFTTLKRA